MCTQACLALFTSVAACPFQSICDTAPMSAPFHSATMK